ncbi:MAG: response regulator [Opitutaceae bacterium]|jgi:two-component system chemotaxis response regulator CheY
MAFNGKILLVDDEPHIRKFVSLLLKQLGSPSIVEAGNGQDAVACYQQEKPDLVLLDVNMPILDGIGTLKAIKEIDSEAVVIMLTSLTSRLMIEQAAELGAANYIRKDTPKEEMLVALKETIEACFETE